MLDDIIRSPFKFTNGRLEIDIDNITNNFININHIDYLIDWLDPSHPGNKGGHSYVFRLFESQDFESRDESTPTKVIKISNVSDFFNSNTNNIIENKWNKRFYREIEALEECNRRKKMNIISVDFAAHIGVDYTQGNTPKLCYPFYMMDYATDGDLKNFIENNPDLDLSDKLDICLQLASGLKELNDLGYYHRDLKPDNIFIFNQQQWKIGDLGLIAYREEDWDKKNELIGPKGWLSPEAMNKYLSEGRQGNYDCRIDHQSDIFQLGKVFWYILQGNAPIGCISRKDFIERNERLYVLIRTMLNYSKKKRIKNISTVVEELQRIR